MRESSCAAMRCPPKGRKKRREKAAGVHNFIKKRGGKKLQLTGKRRKNVVMHTEVRHALTEGKRGRGKGGGGPGLLVLTYFGERKEKRRSEEKEKDDTPLFWRSLP